ncbi:MAG: DUF3102 domain-containing protein [Candidatus Didemnitutus sp.]|nr:DUF3102 domain-containing protein [Candidatus Didemnitutus sp.]
MPNPSSALALVQDRQISPRGEISKLQAIAVQQLAVIRQLHTSAAIRALLVGLTLHRIKAASTHGEWMPWLKKNFDGGKNTANRYMRLALVFVERTKVQRPDLLALPGDQIELALEKPGSAEKKLMDKAVKFVGEKTLQELLEEHGIRDDAKHGKRTSSRGDDAGDQDDDGSADAQTVQEKFNEIAGLFESARKATADKANWMSFSKQQHLQLKALAEDAAEHLATLCAKTHGRAAKN